ncbi:hypothetical protein SDC9_07447 [bioreactor metagenome]|uniref:Uncharacterized protein n=1 Tax=bioreactor metagenome TaxID=1076179 RepID=A0A644T4K1_9ZZZZ|nr:hypothetical protein [Methanobrevibacter sp.]MEA4956903.1 hypothetical protein [Methanobrevibacter sp.]
MSTLNKNEYKGKKYKIFEIGIREHEIVKMSGETPISFHQKKSSIKKYRLENQEFILDKREIGSWSEVVRFLKENDKTNWEKGAY